MITRSSKDDYQVQLELDKLVNDRVAPLLEEHSDTLVIMAGNACGCMTGHFNGNYVDLAKILGVAYEQNLKQFKRLGGNPTRFRDYFERGREQERKIHD